MPGRLATVLLLLLACRPSAPQTPLETYTAFLHDLREGDQAAAYALLSQPTQQALKARAEAVSKASGGAVKPDPVALVFRDPMPPVPSTIKMVSEQGNQATLEASGREGTQQVHLIKEDGKWRIDLTAALR